MNSSNHFNRWQQFSSLEVESESRDSQHRIRWVICFFAVCFTVVFIRVSLLQINDGSAYRIEASRPIQRKDSSIPARGRVLSRDGTILAEDREIAAVAIKYRWLQNPPSQRWLSITARKQLSAKDRRDQAKVAAQIEKVRQQREQLHQRLMQLCDLSQETWNARVARVQAKVQRMAESVNRRKFSKLEEERYEQYQQDLQATKSKGPLARFGDSILHALFTPEPPLPPRRVTILEELDHHVIAEHISQQAIDEIEKNAEQFPGVELQYLSRRIYPQENTSAHLVGHLGSPSQEQLDSQEKFPELHPDDRIGRMGIEKYFQAQLAGRRGIVIKTMNRRGKLIATEKIQQAVHGKDVVLTLDMNLQKFSESLLDSAQLRKPVGDNAQSIGGGAVLLMNLENGEVLTAASAPRFNPNIIERGDYKEVQRIIGGPDHPLLDRTTKMAIPPGSIYKLVTSVALLDSGTIDAETNFFCRGFLYRPDAWRCMVYRQSGIGHADINLASALAQSCNVFFFHHVNKMGPDPLVGWSDLFGFGKRVGCDWSRDSAGRLPTPQKIKASEERKWQNTDTMALSIGQSSLTTTPLQIALMTAAIANGGHQIRPHLVATGDQPLSARTKIPGLQADILQPIRQGMIQAVNHPGGTLYRTLRLESVKIAAKTGTAQTGTKKADHAWVAGFVPADKPKYVFVVALQHAGNASTSAGPVAQRLIRRMDQLGYFKASEVAKKNR